MVIWEYFYYKPRVGLTQYFELDKPILILYVATKDNVMCDLLSTIKGAILGLTYGTKQLPIKFMLELKQ